MVVMEPVEGGRGGGGEGSLVDAVLSPRGRGRITGSEYRGAEGHHAEHCPDASGQRSPVNFCNSFICYAVIYITY